MLSHSPLRYILPIGILIALFLDGSISLVFSHLLFNGYYFIPQLTFLWLFYAMFFQYRINLRIEWWSALAGLLFDSYYTGILGVYVFIFPLAIYVGKKLYKYFSVNIFSALLIYIIDIFLIYYLSFFANRLKHLTEMSDSFFLTHVLGPTLIINVILLIFLYIPCQLLFDHLN
ncbi:rod shape-determining protein MreD [Apilactobacillus apisilvae]|uniref:Rod shape-determining protein MreD n=1 Tax=Apilactobacillus apisilvae TaxID=2923364 RepID=A0ABY4PI87_9LACO|nr:rod shape-determining protein MreD [Apilactobacillus apisilvae]UQS85176.1 rod shape-determining protein MreD [Apilactobacillus apisilvae]